MLYEVITENRLEYIQNLLSKANIIPGMASEDFDYEFIKAKLQEELRLLVDDSYNFV